MVTEWLLLASNQVLGQTCRVYLAEAPRTRQNLLEGPQELMNRVLSLYFLLYPLQHPFEIGISLPSDRWDGARKSGLSPTAWRWLWWGKCWGGVQSLFAHAPMQPSCLSSQLWKENALLYTQLPEGAWWVSHPGKHQEEQLIKKLISTNDCIHCAKLVHIRNAF